MVILTLSSCGDPHIKNVDNPTQLSNTTESSITSEPERNTIYNIKGDEILVREGPGKQFNKIVNQKATDILGSLEYIHVDNTCKVLVLETKNGWSKINVIEPDWLRESHIGWIKSKYVYDPNNTQPESNKESNLMFAQTSKFNGSQISKAVVNTIMGHSMSDMKVKKISENLYRVTYFDPPLNRFKGRWIKTLVKINTPNITWKPDEKWGRWRNDPYYGDEVITYEIKNNQLIITTTYSDNSSDSESFSIKQFK